MKYKIETKKTYENYKIKDVVESFLNKNPSAPSDYNMTKNEFKNLASKILHIYIQVIFKSIALEGYILIMGFGLGRMFCKIRAIGSIKYPNYQFNKNINTKNGEIITETYDSTYHKMPFVKWHKGKRKLKNILNYRFSLSKNNRKYLFSLLKDRKLSHY